MAKLDRHLVSLTAPASFAAEQYQGLRLTIERLARTRDVQVIAVSSPATGDGKTVTAINLAATLARGSGDHVLLIDADLRRPSLARQLGIAETQAGLADALSEGAIGIADVIRRLDAYNLDVIPAGAAHAGVSQLLRSPRLDAFLADARQRYTYIVVDTPPLLPVADSALLARSVDGVLLVVSAHQTPRTVLAEALNMLDESKVLGIVFNRDDRPAFGYYNAAYRKYFPDVPTVASEG